MPRAPTTGGKHVLGKYREALFYDILLPHKKSLSLFGRVCRCSKRGVVSNYKEEKRGEGSREN